MFFFLNISNISFWENTSEVSPSCQFVSQDPSLCTFFLDSCPYQKPPSKWQSSQPVYPQHRTSPAQPPTAQDLPPPSPPQLLFCVSSSHKNSVGGWDSGYQVWKESSRQLSFIWYLTSFAKWFSNTHCNHQCQGVHTLWGHQLPPLSTLTNKTAVFMSAWSHSHHGLNPLVEPPDPSQNFLPQVNPFNFEYHSGVSWISIFPV